jgi:two-component sensor histidine kinase
MSEEYWQSLLLAQQRSPLRNFSLALLILAAAVPLRIALDQLVPERLPFITFFPAVLLTALLCGLWPAIVVLVLSGLIGTWWASPAEGGVLLFRLSSFGLFLIVGAGLVAIAHYLTAILTRVKEQDEQLALINRELKHRIKNLFALTNSICLQTIKTGSSLDQMAKAVSGRIGAVAAAQDLLSVSASEGSDLRALVEALVAPLAPDKARLEIRGAAIKLPADATTPFALILHELATNAIKYGAWLAGRGKVSIEWSVEAGELHFRWREHDGLNIAPAVREGLGSVLIKRGLNHATVSHDIKPDGLECRIVLPLGTGGKPTG